MKNDPTQMPALAELTQQEVLDAVAMANAALEKSAADIGLHKPAPMEVTFCGLDVKVSWHEYTIADSTADYRLANPSVRRLAKKLLDDLDGVSRNAPPPIRTHVTDYAAESFRA